MARALVERVRRLLGGYLLDGRLNDAFAAVNRLLSAGASVRRADRDGPDFRAGDFLVGPGADPAVVAPSRRTRSSSPPAPGKESS